MAPGWLGVAVLLGAAVFAVVGGWLLRDGRRRRRRHERLAVARRGTVEEAGALLGDSHEPAPADTRVRDRPIAVSGTAVPVVGTLQAPFSEQSALVADWRVDTAGPLRHRRVGGGVDAVPFTVEDDTGRALVWPTPGAVTLSESTTVTVDADERPPDPVRRFLAREDAPTTSSLTRLLGGADRAYVEARIDPGDEVVVVGRPRPVPADTPDQGHGADVDATAADGGRPALSVADADVTVAFGSSWDDTPAEDGAEVGLTGSDPGPSLAAASDAGLVVADRSVERLAGVYDDAASRVAAGLLTLGTALVLASVGAWALFG